MRFLMTYEGDDNGPPNPEKLEELGKFSAEMQKSGVLVDTGAMLPVATRLTLASGKFSVTDGPFPARVPRPRVDDRAADRAREADARREAGPVRGPARRRSRRGCRRCCP